MTQYRELSEEVDMWFKSKSKQKFEEIEKKASEQLQRAMSLVSRTEQQIREQDSYIKYLENLLRENKVTF